MNVIDIVADVLQNGGGTYDPVTWEKGTDVSFLVSVLGYEDSFPSHWLELVIQENSHATRIILKSIIAHQLAAQALGAYVGIWTDGENVYIDVPENYESQYEAEAAAIANEQRAYYDAVRGLVVSVA